MIKRLLALIPRSIVHRVPRRLRDRWRTRLLRLEGRLKGRGPVSAIPGATRGRQKVLGEINARLQRLDDRVAGIERRLDEARAELGQLDSRISTHSSGDAPSPLDDLAQLVGPIAELNERLDRLERDSAGDTGTPVRVVGGGDA